MKGHTISYLFLEGLKSLWKNRLMAFASVATIVLSLLVLGMSYAIANNFEYIIGQIEQKIGISVYLNDTLSDIQTAELEKKIKSIPNVSQVSYITKDEALQIFAGEDIVLYDEFKDDNPLPASFEVRVNQIVNQQAVVEQLMQLGLEVNFFQAETDIFISLNAAIQFFSSIVIIILIIISLLLITNTIKLTVFVRKKEIEIMKYIGATDSFIRVPFLVEGISIGIIGVIIPTIVIFRVYDVVARGLSKVLIDVVGGIYLRPIETIMVGLVPIYIVLAIGISMLGSIIALRRHLKV
ncbi:MAG: hypothetical protein BEN19_06540 [Epulopiscium sp. Nuni2H_MBin003]|nr:MAG: hypothetical protein BEN19_06540 [Epulopiscium sp. Nuni2H_MBin003]